MLSPADLLQLGLREQVDKKGRSIACEPLDIAPEPCPPGTRSCISGQPLTEGYRAWQVITKATADPLGQFGGNPDGWISVAETQCYQNNNPRLGMPTSRQCMVFEDGTYYFPTIARESARKADRPCWSELVRDVWPERRGQNVLVLLTTDPKKRLWPESEVGPLGCHTPVFVYGNGVRGTVHCDWTRLLVCLQLVEQVYTLGFPKHAIRKGLWAANKVAWAVGVNETNRLDALMAKWRQCEVFAVALLIAQKEADNE